MALVKGKSSARAGARSAAGDPPLGLERLLSALGDEDSGKRRAAVRELAQIVEPEPRVAEALCDRLEIEGSPSVRAVIFTTLIRLQSPAVAARLATLLRSDDAPLRNGAIEALQAMPEVITPQLRALLDDPDSDVRIFAVNILGALNHTDAPALLGEVIRHERHINVCAAAVDALAEIGTPEVVGDLETLKTRFKDDPFMSFAINTALRRIKGQ